MESYDDLQNFAENNVHTNRLETYLYRFEIEHSMNSVQIIPPPEYSSFYWRNDDYTKHKVFIPTPNRDIYYSLKELDQEARNTTQENKWMDTLKCVSLALSVKDSQDRAIINHMEFIAEIMFQTVFEECSNVLRNDSNVVNNDEEYSKRYSLTKYFIKDLENVHLKDRYKKKWSEVELFVSPLNDQLINAIDIAFSMSAHRIIKDPKHGVYHYGRN